MAVEVPQNAIRELTTYVGIKIKERGFEDEAINERLLMLVEEVGELVKAVRKSNGMFVDVNREITSHIGEELSDVLNMLFAVAIGLDIDLAQEFQSKEALIDQRTYQRSKVEIV